VVVVARGRVNTNTGEQLPGGGDGDKVVARGDGDVRAPDEISLVRSRCDCVVL
jgi:hypothetical protein